jgi:PKHD-type hydroxylase
MILKNYYWYFQSVLTHKFCDELIDYAKTRNQNIALTGGLTAKQESGKKLDKKDLLFLKKKRNSNVVWLDDPWIYKEIHPFIYEANKNAGWNFQWDYSESCQFTKYSKGQHYDWHADTFPETYNSNDLNFKGKIRKLSVTCSLSDPKEYKGGELEFQFRDTEDPNPTRVCNEILPRGSIVVFPSHVWHRVKPVTKGTRYSLVMWNVGYPFK